MRRVVITGMGALTPIGNNLEEYWTNIKNGVSGAGPITKFDTEKFKAQFACELKNFDPAEHFDVKEIKKYDPFSQYALVAVDEAVKNGNINFDEINTAGATKYVQAGIKDLVEKIKSGLGKRNVGPAARFVFDRNMPGEMLEYMMNTFEIEPTDLLREGRYHNNFDFFGNQGGANINQQNNNNNNLFNFNNNQNNLFSTNMYNPQNQEPKLNVKFYFYFII